MEELEDKDVRYKGVFGNLHRVETPRNYAADAVNRTFREGNLSRTRPRYCRYNLIFEGETPEEDEQLFHDGSVQGGMSYIKTSRSRVPGFLLAISGNIFFGRVAGKTIFIKKIQTGLNADVMEVSFTQAEERAYWVNGVDSATAWDGNCNNAPYQVIGAGKIPAAANRIAFACGRLIIVNEFNQIAISDPFNNQGYNISNRDSIEDFIETLTFYGGTYSIDSSLGQIVDVVVMPNVGEGNNSEEVVFLAENGAAVMNICGPRVQFDEFGQPTGNGSLWERPQTIWKGPGIVGMEAHVETNNDIWIRRYDGISTLKLAYQQDSKSWTDPALSRPIDHLLEYDSHHLLRFVPMGAHNGRIFTGVMPKVEDGVYGKHRYCQAMVVADLIGATDEENENNVKWEGLWTGPSPIIFFEINDPWRKHLVVSREPGKNHIYEILDTYGDDNLREDGNLPIRSWVDTRGYDFADQTMPKRFLGLGRTRIENSGKVAYASAFRPNSDRCFIELTDKSILGCQQCNGCNICQGEKFNEKVQKESPKKTYTRSAIPDKLIPKKTSGKAFAQSSADESECGTEGSGWFGDYFQVRHRFLGDSTLIYSKVKSQSLEDNEVSLCTKDKEETDEPCGKDCCGEREYLAYRFGYRNFDLVPTKKEEITQ